jgi:hypothetical protein
VLKRAQIFKKITELVDNVGSRSIFLNIFFFFNDQYTMSIPVPHCLTAFDNVGSSSRINRSFDNGTHFLPGHSAMSDDPGGGWG